MSYTPPSGHFNATISGNTAGAGALLSTGTVTLAGGNNITLSQNGNAITISGANAGGAGTNTLGISNLGNSIGTSGVISGSNLQLAFAGGNNVTLSQSINASSATITVSAANQTTQTQNLHNVTLSGNTAGAMAQISSGTMTLAGGNNITLSQNGNAVTISGTNQSVQTQNLHNVTLSGNTAGAMAQISSGTLNLAGGNNITLSQNGNSVTISGAAQTAQTQSNIAGIYDGAASISTGTIRFSNSNGVSFGINGQTLTASHNGITSQTNQTVGLYAVSNTTQSSSVTADARSLSFHGAGIASVGASNGSVMISVPSGGGAGDGYNSAQFTNSTADSTMNILWAGNSNGSGNITMGLTGSTVTASAPSGGAHTLEYYQNMDRGTSASLATAHRTLMLQRLNQENDVFAGNLTANTFLLNMTANMTATSLSSSHSVTMSIGIYQNQTTRLSLVNSASTSWGFTAATDNTKYYHGPRWMSFVSSQWSSAPNFSQDGDYVLGIIVNSSNYGPPISYIGQNYMHSLQRSGTIGTTVATNTSLAQGNYWNAMHSATQSSMPSTIASNVVNRNNATAIFMPHVILNNRYSGTF